jgi:hypothetical protein
MNPDNEKGSGLNMTGVVRKKHGSISAF